MHPKSMTASIHNLLHTKLEENFIQRERKRRQELLRDIVRMRAELPVYNLQDIRQYKLPYYEALLLELQEKQYVSTEAYIKQLFEFQEKMKEEAGPSSSIWQFPDLKHSPNELKKLSESLRMAEDHHSEGHTNKEMDDFLRAGIEFSFNADKDWWWLGQELILQSVSISKEFSVTGRHEALCRYCLAKLLIENVKDYETAEQHLLIARELSEGKAWNAAKFLPKHNDTLFMCSSYLLHLCYMKQARQLAKTEPEKAIELALMAKKRAREACFHEGETSALLIKGECELMVGDTKSAITTFNKAYYVQSKVGSQEGMCQAKVAVAKAYLQHGNTRLALQNLLLLKEKAEKFHLKFYLAQAYRYLGDYYLNNGEPHKATVLLKDAMEMFTAIGESVQADQVRNLEALSAGLELMPDYIQLITKTETSCPDWFENLMKLVQWKDSRKPFWEVGPDKVIIEPKARYSMEDVLEKYFRKAKSYSARNIGQQVDMEDDSSINQQSEKLYEASQMIEMMDDLDSRNVSGTSGMDVLYKDSETVAQNKDYHAVSQLLTAEIPQSVSLHITDGESGFSESNVSNLKEETSSAVPSVTFQNIDSNTNN